MLTASVKAITVLLLAAILVPTTLAAPPRYVLDSVIDAPYCSSVDVSDDHRLLVASYSILHPTINGLLVLDLLTGTRQDYEISGIAWQSRISWDRRHVWLGRYYGSYVAALDLDGSMPGQIVYDCELDIGSWTGALKFDDLRRWLYIGENDPGTGSVGTIVKVDATSATCGTQCEIAGQVSLSGEPGMAMTLSQAGDYLYATNRNAGSEQLYKIRTSDMQLVDAIALPGIGAASVSLNADSTLACIPHANAQQVYVVDVSSDPMFVTEIWDFASWGDDGFSPSSFWLAPDGSHALLLGNEPEMLVLNMATGLVYQSIPLTSQPYDAPEPCWDLTTNTVYVPVLNTEGGGIFVLKQTSLEGDIDGDGDVDLSDLQILLSMYGTVAY